jgi:hypothetical protein
MLHCLDKLRVLQLPTPSQHRKVPPGCRPMPMPMPMQAHARACFYAARWMHNHIHLDPERVLLQHLQGTLNLLQSMGQCGAAAAWHLQWDTVVRVRSHACSSAIARVLLQLS